MLHIYAITETPLQAIAAMPCMATYSLYPPLFESLRVPWVLCQVFNSTTTEDDDIGPAIRFSTWRLCVRAFLFKGSSTIYFILLNL